MKVKRKKPVRGQKSSDALKENRVPFIKLEKTATALVQPICEAAGMELVLAEFRREPAGRILRLYVDRPGGVSLDDCAHISRQVSDLLEVSMEGIGPYNLEVSSPGTNRPLVTESDYRRFTGHAARISLHEPVNGQKRFKGTLSATTDGTVQIETETGTVSFDFSQIARARLAE